LAHKEFDDTPEMVEYDPSYDETVITEDAGSFLFTTTDSENCKVKKCTILNKIGTKCSSSTYSGSLITQTVDSDTGLIELAASS